MVALLDGERTPSGIKAAFEVRYGARLPPGFVEQFLAALQEGGAAVRPSLRGGAATGTRRLSRGPVSAGRRWQANGYPADPEALHRLLASYAAEARPNDAARANGRLRGADYAPH